jgi:Excreted virulence factor EspC, type VII ESX diderm
MSGSVHVDGQALTALGSYFRDLDETTAAGYRTTLDSVHITGDLTGRSCPRAGDAAAKAVQTLSANVKDYGSHAEDICSALNATAKNYGGTDSGNASSIMTAGSDA